MLTTLGPAPTILVTLKRPPTLRAKWISTRPQKRSTLPRIRLAEGIWIIPRRHWLPASALDVGEAVPPPEAPPTPRLGFNPPAWKQRGLCAQLSPYDSDAMFFGVENREAPGRLIAAANQARRMCRRCPIEAECLTDALLHDERYGVWGGTSGRQREKLRTRLAAGASVDELVRETVS